MATCFKSLPKWLIVLVLAAATPLLSYLGSSFIPVSPLAITGARFGLLGANLCLSAIIFGACAILSRGDAYSVAARIAACLLLSDCFALGYALFVNGDMGLGWSVMRMIEFAGISVFAAIATRAQSPRHWHFVAGALVTVVAAFILLPLHQLYHLQFQQSTTSTMLPQPCALMPLAAVLAAGLWAIPGLRAKVKNSFIDAVWIACLPGFVGAMHTTLANLSQSTGDALLGQTFVLIGRITVIGGLIHDGMSVISKQQETEDALATRKDELSKLAADNQEVRTELLRCTKELRKKDNEVGRLHQALDNSEQLIAIVAPNGKILRQNKRVSEFSGSSKPEQKIDTLLAAPKDFDVILQELLNRKEWEGEIEVRHAPTETTPKLNAQAFRFEQDTPEEPYVVGIVITDKRRIDDLQQQNQRLRWLMGANPNLLVELSPDGKLYYANPVALSAFPLLLEQGVDCPLLDDVMETIESMRMAGESARTRELVAENACYNQIISIEPTDQRIVVASQDVSEHRDQLLNNEMICHRLQWLYELDATGSPHPYEVIARGLAESCKWFGLDQVVLDQKDNDGYVCVYSHPGSTPQPGAQDLIANACRQALRKHEYEPFAIQTGETDKMVPVFGVRIAVENIPWGALYYSSTKAPALTPSDHQLLEMLSRWLGNQISILEGSGRHDAFFNHSNVMLCTCRMDGTFRNLNPLMLGTLDTSLEDMVGRDFETLATDSCRSGIRQAWEKIRKGVGISGLEFEADLPGEETAWLKWWCMPVPGTQLAYCTLVDVSADRTKSAQLQKSHEIAVSTVELKSDILAKVSHEIKAPLNGIVGMVELLEETKLTPSQNHYVEQTRLSADMVLQLTNTLLDFSRLENNRIELREEPFDLRHTIESAINLFESAANAKGIALIMRHPAQMPRFFTGDSLRIQQIAANLVGNAVKFTDVGQVLVSIETQADAKESMGHARISVQDTGFGIAPDEQELVFQSFHQVGNHNVQGTGLGLSIVRQLVEMMGGAISLESEPDKGSCFTIELPLRRSESAPRPTTTICDLNLQRVLLLMTEPLAIQVIRNTLDDVSLVCDEVETAKEALKAIEVARKEKSPYRLIVVDDQLSKPGPDEFAQMVRASKKNNDIQLVRCSLTRRKAEIPADLGHYKAWITSPITPGRIGRILTEVMAPLHLSTETSRVPMTVQLPRPARILVVEDSTVSIEVLSALLKPSGAAIDNAKDGAQAVELACRHKYDLIFMDCALPKMDGFEATQSIRKLEKGKRYTPVVAVTAGSRSREQEKCEAAGMDAFLEKPIRRRRVNRILQRFLIQRDLTKFVDSDSATETASTFPIDIQRAAKEIGVKRDMYVRILRLFTESLDEYLATLDDAYAARDAEQLAMSAHKLGGSSANLRIHDLKNICARVENLAHEENWEALESELEALEGLAKNISQYSEDISSDDKVDPATDKSSSS